MINNDTKEIETITLEVRPAWREAAALRGIPIDWLVNQYVGRTCSSVIRRAKARAEREAKHGNTK